LYKLDGPKGSFKGMKAGIPLSHVTGVTITPGPDQLAVIHLMTGRDMVVALHCGSIQGVSSWAVGSPDGGPPPDLIGEFVTLVTRQCHALAQRSVPVNVTPNVECKLAKKATSIRVQVNEQATPIFAKDGPNKLLLTWPAVPDHQPSRNVSFRNPSANVNHRNTNMTNGNGHYASGQGNGVQIRGSTGYNNNAMGKPYAPPPPVPQRLQTVQ